MQQLVAGVDSSTQSCKVVIRDLHTGKLVRSGAARHRRGTEIDPQVWRSAFDEAVHQAGGLDDVVALSIAGQQHGMVALDERGAVVRNAILWNDTRSARDAVDLISELGNGNEREGKRRWADRTGSVPVASLTVTKIRWMATHEPDNLARTAAVALPHDWLTWDLLGGNDINTLVTDRSDASGTGYYSAQDNEYCKDLLELAAGAEFADRVRLPWVASPARRVSEVKIDGRNLVIGPGAGDNAGAALGLGLKPGEVAISIGTSGVVSLVSAVATHDPEGYVTGFADASGNYLPLVCTLNASRVVDTFRALLNMSHAEFSRAALCAPPGAEGLVVVPYFEGERERRIIQMPLAPFMASLAKISPLRTLRELPLKACCVVWASESVHSSSSVFRLPRLTSLEAEPSPKQCVALPHRCSDCLYVCRNTANTWRTVPRARRHGCMRVVPSHQYGPHICLAITSAIMRRLFWNASRRCRRGSCSDQRHELMWGVMGAESSCKAEICTSNHLAGCDRPQST